MIAPDSDGHPVEALAAEFVERRRRGEQAAIDDYAARHPELADAIRELFPTIEALEAVRAQRILPQDSRVGRGSPKLSRLLDFRIVREIGRGGMGIVYEAIQESLDRRVAVKVLARHSRLDEKHRLRFFREARTAGRLHHTNIVPILGVGEHDGFDFYVMQYIDGVGLDAVISRLRDADVEDVASLRLSSYWRRLDSSAEAQQRFGGKAEPAPDTGQLKNDTSASTPGPVRIDEESSAGEPAIGGTQPLRQLCRTYWQDVALIGLQVAQALDYAHGQGTLHRDIKPANLLIDGHGTTWVADFGLAKGVENEALSRTGEVLGTLLYMAPEQWRGKADARSDVYSLGVTLYELATLRVPCQLADRMAAIGTAGRQPVIAAPRKICPALPIDLETIIMTAMAEDPAHRYQSAGELAADLTRFLEDRPISVRRPTLWERWARWRRRNPATAALSVAAAILGVLFAVVLSVAYAQTRGALQRESAQRERAEATLTTSLQTLENVFRHLVPERLGETQAKALAGDEKEGPSSQFQPVVSPETASLLEDLRRVYDQLGSAGETNERLTLDAARANRRVGDIHARLGNIERAESAYRQSIAKYESLASHESGGAVRLEIARLHNDLGTVLGRKPDAEGSRREHQQALSILQGSGQQPQPADERFELARTYFLLGRGPDRNSNTNAPPNERRPPPPGDRPPGDRRGLPPEDDHPRREPGGPPPDDDRPPRHFSDGEPGHRPPPREEREPTDGGPPDKPGPHRRIPGPVSGHPEELERAIALLEPLVQEDPKDPAYRHLLAQCYRELPDAQSGPLPKIDKAEKLLTALVKEYPRVADYRFELADTYSLMDVPELSPEDFPQAEARLRAAREQSADLADEHPYDTEYAVLHVHILHKLACILEDGSHGPPESRGPDDAARARMDEVGQLEQEAVRRQTALVKRFPENVVYRFWLVRISLSYAQFLLERHQPPEARKVLDLAVAETEPFYQAHPDATALKPMLGELYDSLARTLEHAGEDKLAQESHAKAEKLGVQRMDHRPPLRRDRRRRPPPPPRRGEGPPPDRDE